MAYLDRLRRADGRRLAVLGLGLVEPTTASVLKTAL